MQMQFRTIRTKHRVAVSLLTVLWVATFLNGCKSSLERLGDSPNQRCGVTGQESIVETSLAVKPSWLTGAVETQKGTSFWVGRKTGGSKNLGDTVADARMDAYRQIVESMGATIGVWYERLRQQDTNEIREDLVAVSSGAGSGWKESEIYSEKIETCQADGSVAYSYNVWILVALDKARFLAYYRAQHERLKLSAQLNAERFRHGERLRMGVRVSKDAYVYVLAVSESGRRILVYPNDIDAENFVRKNSIFYIPPETHESYLEVVLQQDQTEATESMFVYGFCSAITPPLRAESILEAYASCNAGNDPVCCAVQEIRYRIVRKENSLHH